ncbi:MAG: hypothetical protein ACYS7Y_27365 [Planctomycetota bacterium]|jgi:hypothetical protein
MPQGKNSELSVGLALERAAMDSNGQSLQVVIRAAEKMIGIEISTAWARESLVADGFTINEDMAESVTWPP